MVRPGPAHSYETIPPPRRGRPGRFDWLQPLRSHRCHRRDRGRFRRQVRHPARIAHGQRVDLRDYIVPGKTTIFDFTSEYCPPCRAIAPALHKLHASRSDIVVVEIDLNRPGVQGIDWQSPVAQQYNMQSIPAFKVYGTDGKLQVEGDEARSYINSLLQ